MMYPDCLDCSRPLPTNVVSSTDIVLCPCGIRYSLRVINAADGKVWERIRKERLFDRKGDELWMSNPPKPQEVYDPTCAPQTVNNYTTYHVQDGKAFIDGVEYPLRNMEHRQWFPTIGGDDAA